MRASLLRKASAHELSYQEILKIHQEKLSPTLTPYYKKPLYIKKGSMQWLWDETGKKYLDLFGGIVTVSVGHCHPRVSEALRMQVDKLWHTTAIYLTEPIHEYARKLSATLPHPLNVVYFVNSGSEANDMALLLAQLHTGNPHILSLRNGYHGLTQAVSSVTNLSSWKHAAPSMLNVHRTMNPDPYRGPWGGSACRDSPSQPGRDCSCTGHCKAGDAYAEQMEDLLVHSIPQKRLAATILEPIQGVGGIVQYPRGFVAKAYEATRKWGGVAIADEVQTGFGRLGSHFWGFQTHGVVPDIVTMAKGMGNGFPMGAVVTTAEIAASLNRALFFNTFGGNPLAATVGQTVLDVFFISSPSFMIIPNGLSLFEVIEEEKLQEKSAQLGGYIMSELEGIRKESSIVGDVRGKGLMLGIELVADKETRQPLEGERLKTVLEAIKEAGVLVGVGGLHKNVIRIQPPMCVEKGDADMALDVLRQHLN